MKDIQSLIRYIKTRKAQAEKDFQKFDGTYVEWGDSEQPADAVNYGLAFAYQDILEEVEKLLPKKGMIPVGDFPDSI